MLLSRHLPWEIYTICWIKNSSGNQGVGPAFRTGSYSRNWLVWKIRGLGVTFSRGALYSSTGDVALFAYKYIDF